MGAGLCDTDGQLSPVTAQLYASSSLWANHNGLEEANGNEACPLLANRERGGVAKGNSSGGKNAFETRLPPHHRTTTSTQTHTHTLCFSYRRLVVGMTTTYPKIAQNFCYQFFNGIENYRDLQTQGRLLTFHQF